MARQISNKRRMQLVMSYSPDWIISIILAAVFFGLENIHGYWREFSLNDLTIRYTLATKERVPTSALACIAFVAPVVIMPLVNLLTVRSYWDWHNSWLGVILSLTLTGSVTQIVKLTVGRPRPDLLARCNPISGSADPTYQLVTSAVCQQTNIHILRDGFRSFFSGHSSLSFAGLGFLSFYLAGKLHLFDDRGHAGKAWISLTPFMGATLVAISRTMDYRHHWQDVFVGAIVGTTFAYFSYRQYFPPLVSASSHRPLSPRIARRDSQGYELPSHRQQASTSPLRPGARQDDVNGSEDDADVAGTVPRTGPGPLESVWHENGRPSHEHLTGKDVSQQA